MFLVKLVARPDARLVEVPLEIEAELPRDFDGAALLAASGHPRKVKLKAPKDAIKLSTAYRTDQLLADLVRSTLRGSPQDAARVQEAALVFVRAVRERRQDGATLLLQADDKGRIDLSEFAPPPAKAAPAPARPAKAAGAGSGEVAAAQGSLADRLGGLERRVAKLESALPRRAEGDAQGAPIPAPAAGASHGRGTLRRGTAVDAFSDGLRRELSARAAQLLGAADRAAAACDQATRLAAEAVRDLGAAPLSSEGDALRRLSIEAAARQRALQRFLDEVDLYAPAELLMAERLLARLSPAGPEGTSELDPAAPLAALGEQLLRDGRGSELLGVWVGHAAPLCGWTLVEPRAGEPLRTTVHEAKDGAEGAIIARLLVPGVLRKDGSVVARARVSLEGESPEAAEWARELREPPRQKDAPGEEFSVSDDDVEVVEELGRARDDGATAAPAEAGKSAGKPSDKPWGE